MKNTGDEGHKGIIVLEGADASGKSTLASIFKEQYGAEIIHCTWTPEIGTRMWDYQSHQLFNAITLSHHGLVVIDRLWPSESIYGDVLRDGTPWPVMGRMMDRVLMKHAAVYVICTTREEDFDKAVERHLAKNDDPVNSHDAENHKYLMERYNWLYFGQKIDDPGVDYAYQLMNNGGGRWRLNWTKYCIEGEGQAPNAYAYTVISLLEDYRRTQYQPALSPFDHNILGHVKKAKYLMIGERVNNRESNPWNWPFYAYRNSSLFLSECLAEMNFNEDYAMWINLWNPDGTYNKHLEPLVVEHGLMPVAMGINVLDMLVKRYNFHTHRTVPHPQHPLRFGGSEAKSMFISKLKEVLI